ncbi:hypothetical protein D3C72_2131530 [compost metagenome]
MDAQLGQAGLQVQPARAAQPDIEYQAAWRVRQRECQQFRGRAKQGHVHADRAEEVAQCAAQRGIVVDYQHHRVIARTGVGRLQAWGCHGRISSALER